MNVDFTRLRKLLLPFKMRTSALIEAIMASFYSPVIGLYSRFLSYYDDEVRRRGYNGQVKNLRHALADELGCDEQDIIFGDHPDREFLLLYDDSNSERYVSVCDDNGPFVPIYSDEAVSYTKDFTVSIPATYSGQDPVIRQILDTYKLASTRYIITYRS